MRVGFQGVPGSYSEEALYEYFGAGVATHAVRDFEDIFTELDKGFIDYGMLPIENSSTGAISQVYDLLNKYEDYIVGEICLKVNHNLLGIKGSTMEDINEVYSHPQAFEQCNEFLKDKNNWRLIPYRNTAVSAEFVKMQNCKSIAAIGSKRASEIYGLDIIKKNINTNHNNYTRFAVIGRQMEIDENCDKISIVLSTLHKPGCLFNVLRYFAENNLNMLKIESRPIVNKPWEYFFYIDYEGNLNDRKVREVTESVKRSSCYFKLLGNYKRHVHPGLKGGVSPNDLF